MRRLSIVVVALVTAMLAATPAQAVDESSGAEGEKTAASAQAAT
jgi:hypothetical protein